MYFPHFKLKEIINFINNHYQSFEGTHPAYLCPYVLFVIFSLLFKARNLSVIKTLY